jgi:hypothetical protein
MTTRLTEDLTREHVELREVLERVKAIGIGSKEGQQELLRARELFLAHVAREDREFYPSYRGLAESSPEAKRKAEQFGGEMATISRDLIAFFDRYRNGGEGLAFARDFGRLYAALFLRWQKEESQLYASYEKLAAAAATSNAA